MRAWCWVACVVVAGCGPSVPTFPIYGHDAGLECGDDLGDCPSGQVCLQGYCYAECSDTRPCGPREECSSEGICVAPTHDAGPPPDTGPPDPCDSVTCDPSTPACRGGTCYVCGADERSLCVGATQICDVGRATCVGFSGMPCSACNGDADCAGGSPMRCVDRGDPEVIERVCLLVCDASTPCPDGYACDTSGVCQPRLGTCTGVRASLESRDCADDTACAPVGAPAYVFTGSCFDDGSGTTTCHHPCSAADPCPGGQSCGGADFCL